MHKRIFNEQFNCRSNNIVHFYCQPTAQPVLKRVHNRINECFNNLDVLPHFKGGPDIKADNVAGNFCTFT